jgi:hypothetical protein
MRILAIGEVGDKTGGDRPREHCISLCKFEKFGGKKQFHKKLIGFSLT